MIDAVDQRLKAWVQSVIPEVPVSFAAPVQNAAERGVVVYLLDLRDRRPPRTTKLPPLQFAARYLVTTWAKTPEEAHGLLGEIVFAAMQSTEFEVELDVPAGTWQALGVPPRGAFLLTALVQKQREEPKRALVREPVVIHASPLMSFHGVVLGPEDTPIAGARVEIPALRLTSTTDHKGRFRFSSLPAGPGTKLEVHARGRTVSLAAAENHPDDAEPFVIRIQILEE